MLMSRSGTQQTVSLLLLYGVMSGLCYSLSLGLSGGLVTIDAFEKAGAVLWLFGPPAILAHGTFLTTYFVETAVVLVLVFIAVRTSRYSRTGAAIAWTITVLAWLFFGFLAYTPAM